MAPTRKSRSVNKRFSYLNEVSPSKDGETSKKSMQRKRKLSDMLGSQWSKDELKQFYKAYRTFGKDWKKVAAAIRNRSVDMVEALYTMNRAYLSLPEGTASVAGLIAMMTDHYCNLDGSDSEQESNDGTGTSRKSQKRPRGIRPNTSKESDMRVPSHSRTVASNSGCLSLLKKRRSGGTRPRAVGKRTPRFPVSYSYEKVNGDKFFSPTKQGLKLKVDANDDDVAHEVALALAEASQRGGSPQVSETRNRRSESAMSSPTMNGDRMHAELELTSSKLVGSEMDDDGFEGSLGSMEAENVEFSKDKSFKSYTRDTECDGMVDSRKGRRLYGKTLEVHDPGNNHSDDIKEACSGTEEGQKLRRKLETGITDGKVSRSSTQGPRKKSKKVLFKRDESSAFDALQTLADLSLMMPETTTENESSVQVKEENDDLVVQSGLPDDMPAEHHRDKPTYSGVKAKGLTPRLELATTKTSKSGKVSALDVSAISEAKQEPHLPNTKLPRRKQNTLASKIPKGEAHIDIHLSEPPEIEARDLGKKAANKGKRSSYTALQQKQGKSAKPTENSSSSTDPRREGDDSAASTVQVPVNSQTNLPTKVRSKRKVDVEKPQNLKDSKFYDKILNDPRNIPSALIHDRVLNRKEKLSNCLLNPRLRRWCAFEWFYSAVDYPWFAKMEFVEYLYHVGLGHIPRLTRVEWGVIRSSLGKPRRFSEQFLKEEKAKLNQYRDSVRAHYTELRAGTREGLPTDLARPLSVGQRVVAIHPKTREIHDGSVLTVDHTRCRVQFDRPELGVEFVMDIDCMPSNPLENMPAALVKHTFSADKFFENFIEFKMNGRVKDQKLEGYMKFSPHENLANLDRPSHVSPSTYPVSNLLKQGAPTKANSQDKIGSQETATNHQSSNSQPSILAQFQAKEADVQALAELTRALDKKEALTWELRRMNDDAMENQKDGDNSLKDSDPFKKQYAAVLVQLNEANDQVSSALYCLRQRNTYQGNFPLAWPPAANSGDAGGILSSYTCASSDNRDSGSHVGEIVESSRTKARTIVDAAMQAMSSLKGKGSSSEEIEETIDYVSSRLPLDDSCMLAVRSSNPPVTVNGNSASPDQLTACALNTLYSPDQKLKNGSDKNEAQIPSELISHCVATLLMIQKCTERQFPPADVAQILDSAVTSLRPCCSQNLPVYAEIQKCMGIIKNQILALIPT